MAVFLMQEPTWAVSNINNNNNLMFHEQYERNEGTAGPYLGSVKRKGLCFVPTP